MKAAYFLLALCAAAALPRAAQADPVPVTDVTLQTFFDDILCPEVDDFLKANATTMWAAMNALVKLDPNDKVGVPASDNIEHAHVVLAPTDAAFASALSSLGLTAVQALADKALLEALINQHIGYFLNGDRSKIYTLADGLITTNAVNATDEAPTKVTTASGQTADTVGAVPAAECVDGQHASGKDQAWLIDAVLIPSNLPAPSAAAHARAGVAAAAAALALALAALA